ncbi:hypothetical protein IB274_04090 [Pseudomonas sp. PDM18]|uniref:hypothetical protein n=1 Tax=Pseudomonas sp. PDM18 TaxID=2769253 RepID=UPI00177D55E5|nr:hypothetical protein [Pseudomonas sp. PDM18]MBD9675865.1 hypothetical protein [Pseudomonas sp. PDM18]
MPLRSVIPVRQPQGSWLYRALLYLRRDFAAVAILLLVLLAVVFAAGGYCAWITQNWVPAALGALALPPAVGLLLFWSEYDWWLFKLGPRSELNLPMR